MAGMTKDNPALNGHSPTKPSLNEDADQVGYRKPPKATRFKPGRSGNPFGRKKNLESDKRSAFTLIFDKTIIVRNKGKSEKRSVEEALQLLTYHEALMGKSLAVREVLLWIMKRECWLAKHRPVPQKRVEFKGTRQDPDNADEAMILLGIAARDQQKADRGQRRAHLLLEPWAGKTALTRLRLHTLTSHEWAEIKRCCHDDGTIVWPNGDGT